MLSLNFDLILIKQSVKRHQTLGNIYCSTCSSKMLLSVCYNKNEKTFFLNEQRNRDDAAKKRANTSGVGESNYYYEDIYNIPPYNSTH